MISILSYHMQDDTLLVIGWGTSVKIASISTSHPKGANGTHRHITMSSMNQVDIVASFQTTYFISGIAPFGDSLVVLAYIPGEEDKEKEFSSTIPSRQVLSSPIATTYSRILVMTLNLLKFEAELLLRPKHVFEWMAIIVDLFIPVLF